MADTADLHCTPLDQAMLDVQDEEHMKTLLERGQEELALPIAQALADLDQAERGDSEAIAQCLRSWRMVRSYFVDQLMEG